MTEYSFDDIKDAKMRSCWKEMGHDSMPLTSAELYRILKRNNLVARLRRRALILSIIGCSGPFLIEILATLQSISVLMQVIYAVFMLACAGINFYWYLRLGKIYKYMTIPLVQAQKKMNEIDRLRKNIKIASWICGAPVLGLLLYEMGTKGPEGAFYGAISGCIIGGAIGLTLEWKNRKQIKAIKQSFTDNGKPEE